MTAGPRNELARLQRIFEQAIELEPQERPRFLDGACAGDDALRRRIEAMLAADAEPGLDLPGALDETKTATEDLPSRLGPFEILSKLGEGGMGIVYEARQETPRRVVALKVIRPGLASPEVLRRFHHESEVLGQLQHPGIAQVHAAGTIDGRPWFAMERVHGLPLDVWVARHTPDVRERLGLAASICDAVHHAHEHGIVHRDLKPANVLVDATARPRVLDFGVARATGDGALGATMHTSTGQLVGTLAYMSPEQVGATGGAVDRRSDVYALGVILYELLAGRLPHDLRDVPIAEALRVIRDEEPSRLSSVSHRFRGDLETIVAKALAKEPDRRYHTAAELGSDIRRHLANEPIVARPTSVWYQVHKFARRNRGLVGGIAGVFAALVLGTVVATTFAFREARQRALFEREAYRTAIAAAGAEIRLHDGGRAAAILDGTSAALRGWEWRYLRRVADRSLRAIDIGGKVTGFAISHDGTRVAATTEDGKLRVWDLDTGSLVPTLPSDGSLDRAQLAFSLDGRRLFVADAATGRMRSIAIDSGAVGWEIPCVGIGPLSFGPDGSLACGAADGWVVAVDSESGSERRRWPIGAAVTDVSYLADGKHVAYRTGGGMHVAELPSWRTVFSATAPTLPSTAGHRLIVQLPGGRSEVLDAAGQVLQTSPVWLHDLSPLDADLGVTQVAEHGVALVDVASGQAQTTLLGHAAEILWTWFVPDGTRIVSHARDWTLRTWDAATPPDPWITPGSGCFHAVSPDGRSSAEAGWGFVRLWDARTGWPLWTRMLSRRGLKALAFDPSASRLVVVGDDGAVFVLDLTREGEHRELTVLPVDAYSADWSKDGREILIAGLDGVTRILDARDGRVLRTVGGADTSAHVVLALGDGSTIATGGRGPRAPDLSWCTGSSTARGSGGVRLWDRTTGRLLRTLDDGPSTVRSLAAGPRRLAAGFDDGAIAIWNLASGTHLRTAPTAAPVTGMAFDPSERRLVVGRSGAIEILDADTLTELLVVLPLPGLGMQGAAFSSDGALVAAGDGAALAVFETEPATEVYAQRALARRLEQHLNLQRRSQDDPDLVATLETTSGFDRPQRRAAVDYARALGMNPNILNSEALGTVRRADAPRAAYELAHRQIRAALPFRPDDLSFLKTLALAELRLGDPRAALATVERTETLLRARSQAPRAVDLAVRAIAEQALGEHARARRTLERLRTVMRSPEEAGEVESQAFLVEAERAVGSGLAGARADRH